MTKRKRDKSRERVNSPRTFVSFFSGALGLDLGLEQAGLIPLAVNENDPVACETIRENLHRLRHPPKVYDCDIRALTGKHIKKDLGLKKGELFVVCGGPPCQAFSTAGRRLGLNDERGNVFLKFVELIGELYPKYAIIENVRGLLSAPLQHRPHSDRGDGNPPLTMDESPGGALHHVLMMLSDFGYEVSFNLYNTANFGVPQIRERVIMYASREGKSVPFMVPTHDSEGRYGLPKWRTFSDAIDGLPDEGTAAKFPARRLKYYRMLKPGQNWRNLPKKLHQEALGQSYFAGGGKTGFLRRLAWDKPSPTLVTSPTMPATDLAHPSKDRPLSVEEYARIQTFDDSWHFVGKIANKYRLIGNAVPILFGKAIGQHLLAFEDGTLDYENPASNIPLSRYRSTDHLSWLASFESRFNQPALF